LKIHHAYKETSYLTDGLRIPLAGGNATTFGNFLFSLDFSLRRMNPTAYVFARAEYGGKAESGQKTKEKKGHGFDNGKRQKAERRGNRDHGEIRKRWLVACLA
jgi:hypothetical protein